MVLCHFMNDLSIAIVNHILQKLMHLSGINNYRLHLLSGTGQVFSSGPMDEQDETEEIITIAGKFLHLDYFRVKTLHEFIFIIPSWQTKK